MQIKFYRCLKARKQGKKQLINDMYRKCSRIKLSTNRLQIGSKTEIECQQTTVKSQSNKSSDNVTAMIKKCLVQQALFMNGLAAVLSGDTSYRMVCGASAYRSPHNHERSGVAGERSGMVEGCKK